jgi:hypothetical protein
MALPRTRYEQTFIRGGFPMTFFDFVRQSPNLPHSQMSQCSLSKGFL